MVDVWLSQALVPFRAAILFLSIYQIKSYKTKSDNRYTSVCLNKYKSTNPD